MPSAAARRLWATLTLKLAQPRPEPPSALGAEPAPAYAMWLERADVDAAVARHPAGRHRT